MRADRAIKWVCALGVVCLFLLPAIAWLDGAEAQPIENRRLAKWPAIDVGNLLAPDTRASLSEYLEDHLRLRRAVVEARTWLYVNVLRDSPNELVHLGREGWLYYDLSFTRACSGLDTPDAIVERVREVGRIVEASGRRFYFVLVPDKRSIHPEHLGSAAPFEACARERGRWLREVLRGSPPPGTIDVWSTLEALAARPDTPPLYLPIDTHWTPYAAARMIEAVLDQHAPGLWDEGALQATGARNPTGDLTRMMGLPLRMPVDGYAVEREGVWAEPGPKRPGDLFGEQRMLAGVDPEAGPGHARVLDQTLFVLHDSFIYRAAPMLSRFFSQTVYLHWENAQLPLLLATRMRDADVVVVQIVERGSYNWIHRVFSDAPFIAGLPAVLAAPGGPSQPRGTHSPP